VVEKVQTHGLQTTKQAMYVQRNIEARSCNHCCGGKAINITYSEYVFIALGAQHAIVISGLSGSTIFLSTLSHKLHDFRRKKY
jgi:hypothetical protein